MDMGFLNSLAEVAQHFITNRNKTENSEATKEETAKVELEKLKTQLKELDQKKEAFTKALQENHNKLKEEQNKSAQDSGGLDDSPEEKKLIEMINSTNKQIRENDEEITKKQEAITKKQEAIKTTQFVINNDQSNNPLLATQGITLEHIDKESAKQVANRDVGTKPPLDFLTPEPEPEPLQPIQTIDPENPFGTTEELLTDSSTPEPQETQLNPNKPDQNTIQLAEIDFEISGGTNNSHTVPLPQEIKTQEPAKASKDGVGNDSNDGSGSEVGSETSDLEGEDAYYSPFHDDSVSSEGLNTLNSQRVANPDSTNLDANQSRNFLRTMSSFYGKGKGKRERESESESESERPLLSDDQEEVQEEVYSSASNLLKKDTNVTSTPGLGLNKVEKGKDKNNQIPNSAKTPKDGNKNNGSRILSFFTSYSSNDSIPEDQDEGIFTNISAVQNPTSSPQPTSSHNIFNLSQSKKLELLKVEVQEVHKDSIWKGDGEGDLTRNRGNNFQVIKKVYKEVEDESSFVNSQHTKEYKAEKAMATICAKIIKDSFGGDFNKFNEMLDFAKKNGGVTNMIENGKYRKTTERDLPRDTSLETWKKASREFQEECKACGIYSGRTKNRKNDSENPIGLRLTFLPGAALTILKENIKENKSAETINKGLDELKEEVSSKIDEKNKAQAGVRG